MTGAALRGGPAAFLLAMDVYDFWASRCPCATATKGEHHKLAI